MAKQDEEMTGSETNREMATSTGTDMPIEQTIAQETAPEGLGGPTGAPVATPVEEPGVSSIPPPGDVTVNQPEVPPAAPVGTDPITVDVVGARPPAQNALQRTAENMAFADDLHNGRIEPKTYHDLFAKKDTLGKIGTLFGLLVSGAGSGLTHQSNAVLDMMNKEIERDLEAQKTNQGNKQNWYKASMEHEKNLADIDHTAAVADATRMGTYGKGIEADINKWKATQYPGLQDMAASTESYNKMLMSSVQDQQNRVNRMVPGPTRDAAQAAIDNTLKPAVTQKIAQSQNVLEQKKNVINAVSPHPLDAANRKSDSVDPRTPIVNPRTLQAKMTLGRYQPDTPGAIPPDQIGPISQEIKAAEMNRNNYADWIDSFKKLQEMKYAGQVPAAGAAASLMTGAGTAIGGLLSGPLGAGIGTALGNITGHATNDLKTSWELERSRQVEALANRLGKDISETERVRLVNALLPAWNDDDKSREEAFRKGVQHFKSQEVTPLLLINKISTPFPEVKYSSMKPKK